MPRSVKMSESPAREFDDDIYEASPEPSRMRTNGAASSMSPSPTVSVSSDKENRSSRPAVDKGKGRGLMEPPSLPSPTIRNERQKRKRTVDGDTIERNRRRRTVEADEGGINSDEYDPEQDIEERRHLRRGLRDLSKSLTDNRSEYLNPLSTGLKETLLQANDYSDRVKQTTDATIDSRLLVNAADLSYKKTMAITSGDTSQGVDVDEFVSKCMSFMRQVPIHDGSEAAGNTQRRRRRDNLDEDNEDGDDGDMLNWEHLGRNACLLHNSRPAVSGFLLGPLSLEKRARKVIVRKAALKPNTIQESRPEVLQRGDIEKSDNSNLTTLCTQILNRLGHVANKASDAVEDALQEDMTDEEQEQIIRAHRLHPDGGFALFNFVVNPHSFGQTVENIFYVSFLIRDGKLGITFDNDGLPYLERTDMRDSREARGRGDEPAKHQAILVLDMGQWEQLIDVFDIKKPMIPHRKEEEHASVGAKGWYA